MAGIGKQKHKPAAEDFISPARGVGRHDLVIVVVLVHHQRQLLQFVQAVRPIGALATSLNANHAEANEDDNDGEGDLPKELLEGVPPAPSTYPNLELPKPPVVAQPVSISLNKE